MERGDAIAGLMPVVDAVGCETRLASSVTDEQALKGGSADISPDQAQDIRSGETLRSRGFGQRVGGRWLRNARPAQTSTDACRRPEDRESRRRCRARLSTRAGAGEPVVAWRGTPTIREGSGGRCPDRALNHGGSRCSIELLWMDYVDALAGMRVPVRGTVQQTGMEVPASSVRPVPYGLTVQPRTRHGSRRPSSGKARRRSRSSR